MLCPLSYKKVSILRSGYNCLETTYGIIAVFLGGAWSSFSGQGQA
jgi:hypothetical protein